LVGQNLKINISTPIKIGKPSKLFSWPWSILPWIKGETANIDKPLAYESVRLAKFLRCLHEKSIDNVSDNKMRSKPLIERHEDCLERLERIRNKTDFITQKIFSIWSRGIEVNDTYKRCLIHGDLHSKNIVVSQGKINGIIDWGDMTLGDPASDLVCFWMCFPQEIIRNEGLAVYGIETETIQRARAWCVYYAAILVDTGMVDNPPHEKMGVELFKVLEKDTLTL